MATTPLDPNATTAQGQSNYVDNGALGGSAPNFTPPAPKNPGPAPATATPPFADKGGISDVDRQKLIDGFTEVLARQNASPSITSTSSTARASVNTLGDQIKGLASTLGLSGDTSGMTDAAAANASEIERERQSLSARRDEEISGISSNFDTEEATLKDQQKRDFAGRSVGLINSGGYLGTTQSHEGALQNLRDTQGREIQAFEAKKAAAVQAAQNAYEDKDFALAKEKLTAAQQLQKDIVSTKDAYASKMLTLLTYASGQQDKATDNARQALGTILTNFGGAGLDNLDAASKEQLAQLADAAGVPRDLLESSFRTLKERNMEATQGQRDTQNSLAQANLAIRQATLSLAQQRAANGGSNVLTPVDAARLGLPRSLVGVTQDQVYSQLKSEAPPTWFTDMSNSKTPGQSADDIKKAWDSFKNEALKTGSAVDYGNLNLPPPTQ